MRRSQITGGHYRSSQAVRQRSNDPRSSKAVEPTNRSPRFSNAFAVIFGTRHSNPRHLKKRFLSYLRNVPDYYPEVRVGCGNKGLLLEPSATHVAPRRAPMKL